MTARKWMVGVVFGVMVLGIGGCKDDAPPRSMADIDVASPMYNTIYLLTATGNKVNVVGGATHPYFDTKNALVRVNGGVDLELYQFSSSDDLNKAAAQVAPDGSKINGEAITWTGDPHFFKTDKMILLYVGNDHDNLVQLASVFGPQFAGKP